jgi:hypothetical protein
MNELRDRFRTLERLDVPDLSDDIHRRAGGPAQSEPRRNRIVAAVVALAVAAAAIGFLVVAFQRQGQQQLIGSPVRELDALVQGVRLRWPESWTLVQLSGESEGAQAWPILQLANYDPGLDASSLCPHDVSLPADGVVLYLQRDLAPLAGRYDDWPVNVDSIDVTHRGCGERTTAAWTVGGTRFQASLAFGPEATADDRQTVLQVFRSLEIVEPEGTDYWHDLSFVNTWYVAWGVRADDPVLASTYLIGDDPMAEGESQPIRVLALNAGGIGWGELDFRESFQGLGDGKHPDRSVAQVWGFASLDVDRVLLGADDGREIECTLGPSLGRYGLPGRPAYVEFEPPLLGEFVALSSDGLVLERERFENYPPAEPPAPSLSPSPQAEEQVWLSDAEAKKNLNEIETAIDGPVLLRGNNWNYPWVVYLSAEGRLTYRDGDSTSGFPSLAASHFRGTRYSFRTDPEILFVGVASHEVAWFGVERRDGRSIAGSIAPVPGSGVQVVSLTVSRPQPGDQLVAKDENGEVLQEEPLRREPAP